MKWVKISLWNSMGCNLCDIRESYEEGQDAQEQAIKKGLQRLLDGSDFYPGDYIKIEEE